MKFFNNCLKKLKIFVYIRAATSFKLVCCILGAAHSKSDHQDYSQPTHQLLWIIITFIIFFVVIKLIQTIVSNYSLYSCWSSWQTITQSPRLLRSSNCSMSSKSDRRKFSATEIRTWMKLAEPSRTKIFFTFRWRPTVTVSFTPVYGTTAFQPLSWTRWRRRSSWPQVRSKGPAKDGHANGGY